MLNRRRVTACFFGDGAVAEGEFHESLNLAALWRLPVVFVCENNLYAMGTALARHQAMTDIARKGQGYAIPGEAVDGMDVLAVEAAMRRAVEATRSGAGPRLLECRTYRFRAHSMYDAELYRSKAEVEEWKRRDPLRSFETALRAQDMLTEAEGEALEQSIAGEIAAAVHEAEAGPWEPVEDLLRDVHTPRTS
jgi:pyruvate dehydrogenase E1 component alpha subunit/2-oxoisovalerate dehydrogenase E1 component